MRGWPAGFVLVATLVVGGLSWATAAALDAEAGERDATARADRAGRERVALWRLDGFLLPHLAQENARPFADYCGPTSPLAAEPLPAWVALHAQLDPAAGWSSPQAAARADRFAALQTKLPPAAVLRALAVPTDPPPLPAAPAAAAKPAAQEAAGRNRGIGGGIGGGGIGGGIGGFGGRDERAAGRPLGGLGGGYAPNGQLPAPAEPSADYALRQQAATSNLPVPRGLPPAKDEEANKLVDRANETKLKADVPVPPAVLLGPLRAVWVPAAGGDELLLVRPAVAAGRQLVQAVWFDWPALRAALVAHLDDVLPGADLVPAAAPGPALGMATLPVELLPGPAAPPAAGWTPVRTGLLVAWTATLLALAAAAAAGRAVVAFADRRVRFVSAVTHELRTPLTSLRLYLDLLAGGLVTDPGKQHEYLVTLSGEADRLHRLIENVLDFARLERRSVRGQLRPVPVAELLQEVRAAWADRLAADGKELVLTVGTVEGQCVRTDPRAAGQVLANLLDNARKYSRGAADPRVWVTAKPAGRNRVAVEVEDRGPGVPAGDRAGLFRAFRRGRDVDAVAGGAGLGLALAARWARLLGGRLRFRPADGGTGACFRLELPGG